MAGSVRRAHLSPQTMPGRKDEMDSRFDMGAKQAA